MSAVTPQAVTAQLTRSAIFLVATLNLGEQACAAVRAGCEDLPALIHAVSVRDPDGHVSCVLGFGSDAWDRLFGVPRPQALHPFREIVGARHAVSTPGDLLFHIRAERMDLCFELAAKQITAKLEGAVTIVDEVHGFRNFDWRDLIGFVDGTENPTGQDAIDAMVVSAEDRAFAGGSYVIVQKYLHELKDWEALPVEAQEKIIGRTKLDNIELGDAVRPSSAHNALTTIVENGEELEILRDNMPFGDIGKGEFGTYFIGYAKSPDRIEKMLHNMFVGRPPGNYDHLLDYSCAVTGSLFFAPATDFLDTVAPGTKPPVSDDAPADHGGVANRSDGSLGIGPMK